MGLKFGPGVSHSFWAICIRGPVRQNDLAFQIWVCFVIMGFAQKFCMKFLVFDFDLSHITSYW